MLDEFDAKVYGDIKEFVLVGINELDNLELSDFQRGQYDILDELRLFLFEQ